MYFARTVFRGHPPVSADIKLFTKVKTLEPQMIRYQHTPNCALNISSLWVCRHISNSWPLGEDEDCKSHLTTTNPKILALQRQQTNENWHSLLSCLGHFHPNCISLCRSSLHFRNVRTMAKYKQKLEFWISTTGHTHNISYIYLYSTLASTLGHDSDACWMWVGMTSVTSISMLSRTRLSLFFWRRQENA